MRLLIFIFTSLLFIQFSHAKNYQQLKKDIEQTYGIHIEFDNIEFPSRWKGTATGKPHKSSSTSRKKSLKHLLVALKKYRISLVKVHLKKVFILDKLYIGNDLVAGTYYYGSRSLFLEKSDLSGDDSVFHHEFSSLLLLTYYTKNFYLKWVRLNPSEFTYFIETPGGTVLGGDNDLKGYEKVFKKGFVAGYGQASFENDFNTYFELMIGNPVKLAKLEVKYPVIKKKAELVRKIYYEAVYSSK